MAFHTYPVSRADNLEDEGRYRYCSREELLGYLALAGDETVADLGSGTGFYTDDVAPYVATVYAVDVQPEMHDYYRGKGVPENVRLVTAAVADLPFAAGDLDAAFSTMTYHEFATPEALATVRRALASGGCLVTVDWTARGEGESGPPVKERFDADEAATALADAGFEVVRVEERVETFVAVAVA